MNNAFNFICRAFINLRIDLLVHKTFVVDIPDYNSTTESLKTLEDLSLLELLRKRFTESLLDFVDSRRTTMKDLSGQNDEHDNNETCY